MKKNQLRCLTGLFLFFLMLSPSLQAKDKLPVFVSILPQKTFVEAIGKDAVEVNVMVLPGMSPHTFEPKPRQMVAVSRAALYFAIGVEFETVWLDKIASLNQAMKIIHLDEAVEKIRMISHHDHGEGEHHDKAHHDHEEEEHQDDHGTWDPHVWLSPVAVKQMADVILQELQLADPARKDYFQSNHRTFIGEVSMVDRELKRIFAGRQGMEFIVFHPSWGYFARDYQLKQVPIEVEGKDPKPAQLVDLIIQARQKNIRVVFAQPQFSTRNAALVAKEINGEVIAIDPLAEDWTANMKSVAEQFEKALK